MNDVLVNRAHPIPSIRVKTASIDISSPPKPLRSSPQKQSGYAAVDTLSRAIKGANNLVLSWRDGLTELERENRRKVEERKQILYLRMKNAETRKHWQEAAEELDTLEGNDQWKLDPSTADYNPELINVRLKDLDDARTNCDISEMMHLVRTALSRDLGGMGNVDLYRHSYVGTKELIERYVDSAIKTINDLVEKSAYSLPEGIGQKDLLEGMLYARQSFGRSALLLSGGATFGMSHIGVLKALFDSKLLPRIISGASAGSIVCAVLCTRTDEEIPNVIKSFPYGDLAVFEGPENPGGFLEHLRRLLTEGSWSDIKHLTRVMRGLLGDITFQEAYNRTRRILNICVSTESIYELPRLLNYVTAPNVMIWSAVAASCSVPLVFSAAPLLVKNPITGEHTPWNPTPQRWIDGSVDNDLPMTRLAELFNVNHFIVSQVNPHVVPFLARDDQLNPATANTRRAGPSSNKEESDWVYTLTALAKDEALHRLQFLAELGFFPNVVTKLRTILSQKYSGDINILPEISVHDLPRILKNPDAEFMLRSSLQGERATWPKMSRIRDRCAIELALDRAVHRLRARVVFSESQVDLRRLATGIVYPPWPTYTGSKTPAAPGSKSLVMDPAAVRSRQRRSSGSSLQLMAHHRRLMMEDVLTDYETEEEERLEMQARHEYGIWQAPTRKPRLNRAAKSHYNVPLGRETTTDSLQLTADDARGFDFSKPLTPPLHERRHFHGSLANPGKTAYAKQPSTVAGSEHTASSRRKDIVSLTDEMETSEHHSSDGDIESHTDETMSDPDPYDQTWSHPGLSQESLPARTEKDSHATNRQEVPSPSDQVGGLWD